MTQIIDTSDISPGLADILSMCTFPITYNAVIRYRYVFTDNVTYRAFVPALTRQQQRAIAYEFEQRLQTLT
jgi:hypothetical protein